MDKFDFWAYNWANMVVDTNLVRLNIGRFLSNISDSIWGVPFPTMVRVKQKTVSHCGPASLEMLVSYLGKKVNQDKLVSNTGSSRKWFELNGVNIYEMKAAISNLFPDFQFWYKNESSLKELSKVINKFKYPVGVEWQGIFDYEDTDYDSSYGEEDDDPGHYGVVTAINIQKNIIRIADPERHYAGTDRRFLASFFKKRWWDTNQIGKKVVTDKRMMFVITKKDETWPKKLGMKK